MCEVTENIKVAEKCDNCGLLYDADCVKRSETTSEYYCTEGENNCWDLVAKKHEEEQIRFGYEVTKFS